MFVEPHTKVPAEKSANIAAIVAELERAWQRAAKRGGDAVVQFHELVQHLAEEGEAWGYPKVAELATILDVMLGPVVEGTEKVTAEFKEIIRNYLNALQRLSREEPALPSRSGQVVELAFTEEGVTRVFILESDDNLADDMSHQLAHFGYQVQSVRSYARLLELLGQERPHALIMDVHVPDADISLVEATHEVRARVGRELPVLFLTESADIEDRLRAARAGADAYIVKPVDHHELIDQLDQMTSERVDDPFHIVIVEDSTTQANYCSTVLQRAGMQTAVVNDPMRILNVLEDHSTDLILMDMYMPGCNGMELARVIRQFPRYASIPIVFLSAETEIERQLDAMSLGGDDFLTKPIEPSHLIRSVAIRAERARTLRSFMLTDNLTGLLNHTRIKEQLHNEVARAERRASVVSFAMLDIDKFKSVNDTHGHHVGDRVIKTLARVLQQRLRQTDYIGRYGGEEFAVILPDADVEEAVAILDGIRRGFGKIRQFSPKGVFDVSFSGGVASYPTCSDPVQLALEADKALYAAKHAGRNRILAADMD